MAHTLDAPSSPWTLNPLHPRALTLQFGLVLAGAWALPALIHLLGLPVRQLLPMHWPAILAGLVYGWRSGAVIGAASPIVSYLISGMPSEPRASDIIPIAVFSLFLSLAATVYPSWRASRIRPAEALRYE